MTLFDLAQPLFLSVMGTAVVLSYKRRAAEGQSRGQILRHALLRAVILFAIGVLIDGWLRLPADGIRLVGPLQQIAICYLIAAMLVHWTNWQTELGAIVLLLVNYTLLFELYPGGTADAPAYSINHNLAVMLDGTWLPGRKFFGTWDPFGYATLLPAMALTVAGMIIGRLYLTARFSRGAKVLGLLASGGLFVNNGFLASEFVPANPYLATTPFVMIALGAILVGHGLFSLPVAANRASAPLAAVGRNALAVIVVQRLLPWDRWVRQFLSDDISGWLGNVFGLVVAVVQVILLSGLVWWLTRKKWHLTV